MGFRWSRFARKRATRSLVASGLMVLVLTGPGLAPAAENPAGQSEGRETTSKTVRLEYELHWRFLHILTFTSTSQRQASGHYRIETEGETVGIVDTFFPWKARSAAEGITRSGHLRPSAYESRSHFRGKTQEVDLSYEGDTPKFRIRGQILTEGEREPVPEKLQQNTQDPLTAIAELTRGLAMRGKCDGRWPIFDGLRRYDLLYDDLGPTDLETSGNDPWSGPARLCRVRFDMRAGQWRGEERPEEDPSQVLVWLQTLVPGQDPIPVRFRVESEKGALDVHLVKPPESG